MLYDFDASAWKAETGESLRPTCQHGLHSKFQVSQSYIVSVYVCMYYVYISMYIFIFKACILPLRVTVPALSGLL